MSNLSKSSQVSRAKQLILGTNKHYANASGTLQVAGATFTVTALTQLMQDFVDNRQAVDASRAAMQAKLETEVAQAPSQLAVMAAFETIVRASFGTSIDALADFGIAPRKARAALTAEQKAVAVAKRAATRAARHTMGKTKKKAVKGAVSATLVVTPLAGSPPAPAGTTPHVP